MNRKRMIRSTSRDNEYIPLICDYLKDADEIISTAVLLQKSPRKFFEVGVLGMGRSS